MKYAKKILLILGLFVITGILTFGVSFALKGESVVTGYVSVSSLKGKIVTSNHNNDVLYPGEEVDYVVNIRNTGNVDCLVRVKIDKKFGTSTDLGGNLVRTIDDDLLDTNNIILNIDDTKWIYINGYYYYKDILSKNTITEKPLIDGYHVDFSADNSYQDKLVGINIDAEFIQASGDAINGLWGLNYESIGIEKPSDDVFLGNTHVDFKSPSNGFVIDTSDIEIFSGLMSLEPGTSRSEIITVKNSYDKRQKIYFSGYLDDNLNINEFLGNYITVNISNDGTVIYNGSLTDILNNKKIILGDFSQDDIRSYLVRVSISPDMGNQDDFLSRINWVFGTYIDDGVIEDEIDNPYTNDDILIYFVSVAISLSIVLMGIYIIKSRKDEK